jgi:hypothetical protein
MTREARRVFASKWNGAGFTPRKLMLLASGISELDVDGYAVAKWRELPLHMRDRLVAAAEKEV